MEIWKPYIYNFEVSNQGRIRNNATGHILKSHANKNGYQTCVVSCGGRNNKIAIRLHVAVAKLFIDNPYHFPEVNHIDGNKNNNDVSNLEWISSRDNTLHAIRLGLRKAASGERCYTSKLTEDDVNYIRQVYIPRHRKYGLRALARKFGVYHTTIEDVVKGATWNTIM